MFVVAVAVVVTVIVIVVHVINGNDSSNDGKTGFLEEKGNRIERERERSLNMGFFCKQVIKFKFLVIIGLLSYRQEKCYETMFIFMCRVLDS